jgi:hypothetical protein
MNQVGSGDARALRLAWLGVVLLALLPSLGTLAAPWIAEDSALLAAGRADGPWADWTRSQGGLLMPPRFWRPLVSTSWALQAAWTGIAPVPLRLCNVGLHALAALLVLGCARRLGARPLAAFAAGAWVALFPEQGGTSTWLAGRTDLLGAVGLLGAVFAALGPRPLLAAPLAFLACSAKEFGFLAPLWIALLVWGRGSGHAEIVRRAWPAGAAVLVAFVARGLALGGFGGGYQGELPGLLASLAGAARALSVAAWPSALLLALALAVGARGRSAEPRACLAALAAAALAAALLAQLLANGHLEPENRRLLYVPECALGLALALAWGRAGSAARGLGAPALWLAALVVLAPRAVLAWRDTHAWALSAEEGEAEVVRVRAALAGLEPSDVPVVGTEFPSSRHDAYCLGYGLAARFRAPFPATPRPVWPWRLVGVPEARREREPLTAELAEGLFALEDAPGVARLALAGAETRFVLDERSFRAAEDRSPRLALVDVPAGARLEAVVACELGYESFVLDGEASGASELSLMTLLARSNGVVGVGELLMQAADLHSTRALVQLRAVGADGRVLAASPWLELAWPPELLARALSGA